MKILLMLLMIDPTPPLSTPVFEYHQFSAEGHVVPGDRIGEARTDCDVFFHETNAKLRRQGVFPEQSKVIHYECRNAY